MENAAGLSFYESCVEILSDENPDAVLFDGLESAMIGIASQQHKGPIAVYDYELIIKNLVDGGMEEEDAYEHMSFNIEGAYLGEYTPMILRRPSVWRVEIE